MYEDLKNRIEDFFIHVIATVFILYCLFHFILQGRYKNAVRLSLLLHLKE